MKIQTARAVLALLEMQLSEISKTVQQMISELEEAKAGYAELLDIVDTAESAGESEIAEDFFTKADK